MTEIIPTVGRIVWFKMPSWQADAINARRKDARDRVHYHAHKRTGAQVHVGNEVKAGKLYAAMIVEVWGNTPQASVNLQVFLDGNDALWATSVHVGENYNDYQWMPYQKGQAAKTEALEAKAQVAP